MSEHKTRNIFVEGAIQPEFIANAIKGHSMKLYTGAHGIFLGQVRADTVEDKNVIAIEYTAYEEMAVQIMQQIREQLFTKHELDCAHVYHSTGIVHAGEICLFIFTSSKHRKAALGACEELTERIKTELPIWGKEIFGDNSVQWKINN